MWKLFDRKSRKARVADDPGKLLAEIIGEEAIIEAAALSAPNTRRDARWRTRTRSDHTDWPATRGVDRPATRVRSLLRRGRRRWGSGVRDLHPSRAFWKRHDANGRFGDTDRHEPKRSH